MALKELSFQVGISSLLTGQLEQSHPELSPDSTEPNQSSEIKRAPSNSDSEAGLLNNEI